MPDLSPDVERELEALDDALAGRRVAPDLTELGELALLLRDERPQPSDGFGRHLDTRAARGFPERDPRARASGRRWSHGTVRWPRRWASPPTVLMVAVFAITSPEMGSDDSGGGGEASVAMDDAGDAGSASGGSTGSASGGSAVPEPQTACAAAAAATSAPRVPEPADRAGRAAGARPAAARPGTDGRADAQGRALGLAHARHPPARHRRRQRPRSRTSPASRAASSSPRRSTPRAAAAAATFALRIPTRNLDAAMAALSRLGAVRERAQRVRRTSPRESVSARSRLKDARTERESLLKQLADADTLQEAASIRAPPAASSRARSSAPGPRSAA